MTEMNTTNQGKSRFTCAAQFAVEPWELERARNESRWDAMLYGEARRLEEEILGRHGCG